MSIQTKAKTEHSYPPGTDEAIAYFRSLGLIDRSHEGQLKGLEIWSKTTLKEAGFPTDPTVSYNQETGERLEEVQVDRRYTLIQLVSPGRKWPGRKLPSYRFDSREGFAARTLMALSKFRRLYSDGAGNIQDALLAHADLWFMAGKAEEKFALQAFRQKGAEKARGPKWLVGIQEATNMLVKEDPRRSAREIWETSSDYDNDDIEVDGQKYDVYRKEDEFFQIERGTGKKLSIEFRASERYVRRAKNSLRG